MAARLGGMGPVVTGFLRPSGRLYLAEGHPAALVIDDTAETPDGKPGWFAPHFGHGAVMMDGLADYADPAARLRHARTHTWVHPLDEVLEALNGAGLALDWLHEHPRVIWRMFRGLVRDADGLFTWPDRPWSPFAYPLSARKRTGASVAG